MMDSAALAALQQSERKPDNPHVAPIELRYRGRGRFWLSVSSVLIFCGGFIGHQLFLEVSTPAQLSAHAGAEPVIVAEPVSVGPERAGINPQRSLSELGANAVNPPLPVSEARNAGPTRTRQPLQSVPDSPALSGRVPDGAGMESPVISPSSEQQALLQMQLALLQRNAAAALERDRLLTPAHDNAVFYYQSMLALDQSNAAAKDGLRAVAERYIELYERLQARGDDIAAADMLANAERVLPGSTALLATPAAGRSPGRIASPENVSVNAAPDPEPVSAVTLSAASQRSQLLNQVISLNQRGQYSAVVALLEPEAANGSTDAALMSALHAAYLATGDIDRAKTLSQRPGLPDHVASLMRAQLAVTNNDYVAAISELEQTPPAPSENPEYFTLLAGLYYETGRHQDSQFLYRELLKQDTRNGRWWLGYAVASDALNHTDTLMAYQGALKYLVRTDSARQYAEQRVSQLSGKQGLN